MRFSFAPILPALALGLSACVSVVQRPAPPAPQVAVEARAPITVLVSIDGFHLSYLDRGVTPNLSRLAAEGATGEMRPSFPSKTFPNHWTLVTGMVPDRHGIVANSFEDPARPGETFTMASDDPFWWNAAEPIWVTAEKAGVRTGTIFWPGSNVGWGGARAGEWPNKVAGGTRPSSWQQYAEPVSEAQRVDAVVDLLRRPAATRARFLTLYFEAVDTAGHQFGPAARETTDAVAEVDRSIGRLLSELAALGQPANLVIVSDHGMAATSTERTVALDKVVPAADARVFEAGPYATFYPAPGRERAVERALLKPHPHMQCWRKGEMPARFRYGTNQRIPPYLCLAEMGWTLAKTAPAKPMAGGNHGYDPHAPEMRALFVANGPAFRPGVKLQPFDNVSVAPLLRELIGLPAGRGLDGTAAPFEDALTTSRSR
ncbi:ectonucleotide pyrophosphatase/phosphodiesterase [Sphingomonas lenta]|uniref:Alkaline phosphatase family protein n=1 Tax=Sphingomonas lenta TaxID=1141887 RepID=A0A2A2SJP2_9SPHN|nr:ectonucleotide pyrophosphatase/phosphodiesterase [Sphingomonas lenta]PAX09445.1 alkaline phosphatase family protein [Sphingomonas lenta]